MTTKVFKLFLAFISISMVNLKANFADEVSTNDDSTIIIIPIDGGEEDRVIVTDPSFEENEPPVYTEEELLLKRQDLGIFEGLENELLTMYEFRTEGKFVISKENFKDLKSAQNFCLNEMNFENLGGMKYNLIDPGVALGLTFMGLPFSSLLDTAVMYKPVIDFEGLRTGVVFWTTNEFDQVSDNTVFGFTDGNGAGAGAFQDIAALNKRLIENNGSTLAMPVICIDDRLKSFFEGPEQEEEEVIIIDAQ